MHPVSVMGVLYAYKRACDNNAANQGAEMSLGTFYEFECNSFIDGKNVVETEVIEGKG